MLTPSGATRVVGAGVPIVAVQRDRPRADTRCAEVTDGARVAIVTRRHDLCECAASQAVAAVFRTDVAIVAVDLGSYARPIDTMIPDRAAVSIEALPFGERLMDTPFSARAGVDGTGVAIVTRALVGVAVAVIIESVTNLGSRRRGIACLESILGAHAAAYADPVLVLLATRGRET